MAEYLDDYGNPLTNDDGGNWQPSEAPATAPDYSAPPPVSVEDSIFGGDFLVRLLQFVGDESGTGSATVETGSGTKEVKGAGDTVSTGESGGSWLTKTLDYVRKDIFGFSDKKGANNDFPKLLATGAALAIGGAGKAYSESKRLAQEKEIADKRLLLESQKAGIIQSNQNFANVKFKPPAGGLINTFKPAKITSLKDRIK